MKHKTISRKDMRRSSLASFAIEDMKPSENTLKLVDNIFDGKISKENAISLLREKYKAPHSNDHNKH